MSKCILINSGPKPTFKIDFVNCVNDDLKLSGAPKFCKLLYYELCRLVAVVMLFIAFVKEGPPCDMNS